METVEQLSQTGAALLNKYPLIIPFNSALGLQPEQLIHRGAFTPELESSIKTTPWLEPIAGDRLKPNPLNANGLIDTTQQTAAGSKTVRVDPLTGIARGAALACTTEKTVSLSKGESVLDAAINRADQQLKLFTADPDFLDKMQQAFGEDWQPQTALKLVPQVAGEAMRKIEVLPTSVLSANGAFGRGKIYLKNS